MRLAIRVLFVLLIVDVVAFPQELLRMYDPGGRITKTSQKGFCDVPRAVRQEIIRVLKTDRIIAICRMPASRELYLVSAQVESYDDGTKDYGFRFLLLTHTNREWRIVYHSKGMMDSYILHPVFYIGKDRILVLGETGAEEFWELQAFEYRNGGLKDLRAVEIGRLQSNDGLTCWVNPLRNASVTFVSGTYRLRLRGELYLYPDSYNQRKIGGPGSITTLISNGKGFKVVSATNTKGK